MSEESFTATSESLSEDELRLVHALQLAPRASWAALGEVLGIHPTTLAARWERLRGAGLAWVSANELTSSGQGALAFVEVECELAARQQVITELGAIPHVLSIDISARSRDLLLTVRAESVPELSSTILERISSVAGIRRFQTSITTRIWRSGESWQLTALNAQERAALEGVAPRVAADAEPVRASAGMRRILASDGRASAAEIARAIGAHPTTVQRQLGRVLAAGRLKWRCEIAQGASGYPVTCQWFARLAPEHHAAAAAALAGIAEVRLVVSITGQANFMVTMWLASVSAILEMEQRLVALVPEIELLESAIALTIVKRMGWLLRADGTAIRVVTDPAA